MTQEVPGQAELPIMTEVIHGVMPDTEEELVASCVIQFPYFGTMEQAKRAINKIQSEVKLFLHSEARVTGFTIQSATRIVKVPAE